MVKQDYINELNKLKKINIITLCKMQEFLSFIPKKYFIDKPKITFVKKRFPRASIVVRIVDHYTYINALFYESNKKVIIDYKIKEIEPSSATCYSGRCTLIEPGSLDFKTVASFLNMMLNTEGSNND